jgi:hypothetical protein
VRNKDKLDYTIVFVASMIAVVTLSAMVALVMVRRLRAKSPGTIIAPASLRDR